MVTNPIYEGPQYEVVHPELNTLTASQQTADVVASVDNPFYQALPTPEVALASETTIVVASEPFRESEDENRPRAGTDPSNTGDSYIAMNPIGPLGTLV